MSRRQQLLLNNHLPAINELLQVRALQKLISAFGESLIEAINPVTGRLHTSFLIAGARDVEERAEQLVAEHWDKITRLAKALSQNVRDIVMSGEEMEVILSEDINTHRQIDGARATIIGNANG